MKVVFDSYEYKVARAEQHLDGVHLFNDDGSLFVIVENPDAIKSVEDGEIEVMEQPDPTIEDRMAAMEVALLEMMGVSL